MAENLSALELVPRGVEGTGKAVVLGNEPVVQSLARLSGRMDNLAKLKLYAQAKKAEAKQPKVEYDKTPFDIPGLASGVATSIVSEIVNPEFEAGVKIFPSLNPDQKQQYKSTVGRLSETGNNFILKTEADLPKRAEELKLQGWEVSPQDFSQGARLFFNENISAAQQEAEKAGITDENAIRKSAGLKTILNPMGLVDAFSRTVTSNPNKINLNNFGARIIKNIDETGVDVEQADGTFLNINRNNVRNNDKSLNYDLIKRAISANPMDEKMLNLASSQYLESAAKRTGNVAAANAVDKYLKGEKISDDELKLIQEEALPSAQNAVIEKMFAGKGKFEYKRSLKTDEQEANAAELAKQRSGEVSGVAPLTLDVSTYAVIPSQKGGAVPLMVGAVPDVGTKKGKPGVPQQVLIPKVNFGMVQTKKLGGNRTFDIASGSKVYLTNYVHPDVEKLLINKTPDGGGLLVNNVQTNSVSLIPGQLYVTDKNPEYKTRTGQTRYLPSGIPVNKGTYNAKSVGDGWMVIDAQKYIDTMPAERKQKIDEALARVGQTISGLKMLINVKDNPQVLTEFKGELGKVSKAPGVGSTRFLGQ
jgi:hypothetical protein